MKKTVFSVAKHCSSGVSTGIQQLNMGVFRRLHSQAEFAIQAPENRTSIENLRVFK